MLIDHSVPVYIFAVGKLLMKKQTVTGNQVVTTNSLSVLKTELEATVCPLPKSLAIAHCVLSTSIINLRLGLGLGLGLERVCSYRIR